MSRGNYKNPCLTMHQPWASLLVHGIKRIEGRSWPAPIRGRLWIHAASKVPDEATIKAMEEFYQEIYAVDGITDIQFPQHYPVSRLIGILTTNLFFLDYCYSFSVFGKLDRVCQICDATRMIQFGDADVMVAGGTESRSRALSTKFNSSPQEASRPFDGMVLC